MTDRIPGERIGIIGHSISGSLALKLAASDKRIAKVMTTGSMGAVFPVNEATLAAWSFPADREQLRLAAESFIHDKSLIDDAYLAAREKVLFSGDYEAYFGKMFEGDRHRYIDQARLSAAELSKVACDVMMVHGRDDKPFPAEPLTVTISRSIPHADVVLLGRKNSSRLPKGSSDEQRLPAQAQGLEVVC
jgi:2-hydroxymuconate-semialdehyde hydrolase